MIYRTRNTTSRVEAQATKARGRRSTGKVMMTYVMVLETGLQYNLCSVGDARADSFRMVNRGDSRRGVRDFDLYWFSIVP
jgi:hypothetical protein